LATEGTLPSTRVSSAVWSPAKLLFQPAEVTQVYVPPLQPE
jgi:hypothetical protein